MPLDTHFLQRVGSPCFIHVVGTVSAVTDLFWSVRRKCERLSVTFLDGKRMGTTFALFSESAAALQFPYYFGANWDAFDECITDLEWLYKDGYVLVVLDAVRALSGAPDEFPVFMRTLSRACQEWSTPVDLGQGWDRPARPFHVVLHSTQEEDGFLVARVRTAGVEDMLWRVECEGCEGCEGSSRGDL